MTYNVHAQTTETTEVDDKTSSFCQAVLSPLDTTFHPLLLFQSFMKVMECAPDLYPAMDASAAAHKRGNISLGCINGRCLLDLPKKSQVVSFQIKAWFSP